MTIETIDIDASVARVRTFLEALQKRICTMFEREDPSKKFAIDVWEHHSGGGGISQVLEEGAVIEKCGVNFSHVYGAALPNSATLKRPELASAGFEALGVSVVCHPNNPYAPTSHFNVRFIVSKKPNGEHIWWFGGGYDLTPYYGFIKDCIHWHECAKSLCDNFGRDVYSRYKKWCDEYFYLPHRQEPRGIGGLFFDDLNEWGFERCFDFMRHLGTSFIDSYQPLLNKRKNEKFGAAEKEFQLYRRGRYVEFNLLYDRGTLFGLQSGGRVESILMSLPPNVKWKYQWQPTEGSREQELYDFYLKPKDWLNPSQSVR